MRAMANPIQPKLFPKNHRGDERARLVAMFYPLYVGGILFFCVLPAQSEGAWTRALGRGALLGLIAYATYGLSNLATLRGWSLSVTLVDIVWGMVASRVGADVSTGERCPNASPIRTRTRRPDAVHAGMAAAGV